MLTVARPSKDHTYIVGGDGLTLVTVTKREHVECVKAALESYIAGEDLAAIRGLAEVRRLIAAYWQQTECDWRPDFALTAPIADVVRGLIADAEVTDRCFEDAQKRNDPLHDEITSLKEALAESKRPFSAQMEMQNRRIIDLTAQLDRLKDELSRRTEPQSNQKGKSE